VEKHTLKEFLKAPTTKREAGSTSVLAQQPTKHRAQLIWDGGYLRIASIDIHPPDKNQAAEPELSKR
jgi:hypothetical protein